MTAPMIVWDNRLADATPVASSTASGAAINLADFRPYTSWKPTTVPATITVDCVTAHSADSLGLFNHDLFSGRYSVEVRGSTDNFVTSDVLAATYTPTSNSPFITTFTSASYRYWRIGVVNFPSLGQTVRNWIGMAAAPNGNVYACVYGGDIYMQTGGTGNFVALGQTSRAWHGVAAAPNGNVYASENGGDIYMQTGGTGNFVALGQTARNWFSMAAAPNGNVYALVYNSGDIYMQTGGTGNFVALGQTVRSWYGIAAAPNGDVYACVYGGDMYKQTGGAGNFVALGQTGRTWWNMAVAPNGNVYICV